MDKRNLIFDTIISHFLDADQLGDYDSVRLSLTLYCIPNNAIEINKIKLYINSMGVKHKIIILSPDEETTNIKILDIGV